MIVGIAAHLDKKVLCWFLLFTLLFTALLLTAFLSPQVRISSPFSPRGLLVHPPSPTVSLKEIPQFFFLLNTDHTAFSRPYSQNQSFRPTIHVQVPSWCPCKHTATTIHTAQGGGSWGFSCQDPPSLVGGCVVLARLLCFLLCPSYSNDLSCVFSCNSIFLRKWYLCILDCLVISFSFCVCINPCLAAKSVHGQQGWHGSGACDRVASARVATGRESFLESCQ